MTGRLKNKIALVTAAGQGIGRATVERFIAEGAHVIATSIDVESLSDLEGCTIRQLDVTKLDDIKKAAADIGAVDILFNCAGFVDSGTILECDQDSWDFSFQLNVTGMYRMIRAFLPAMLENGGGSIINMASVVSSIKGVPNRFVYGASKAAVIGLTKAVAADFVTRKIRCNAICPGTIASPSLEGRLRATGDYEKARTDFIARQPMGRLGEADEIAEIATYLACDGGWTT